MTAPLAPPTIDWGAVLVAGMAAQGITVTASWAAPLGCCIGEVDCPGGHYWLTATPAQMATWEQNGERP